MTRLRLLGGMLFLFGVVNLLTPYRKHLANTPWPVFHYAAAVAMLVAGVLLVFGKLNGRGRA